MQRGVNRRPPLPAGMSASEYGFFAELRRLANAAGLTVRALEELTSSVRSPETESFFYSKSQWARWINGQSRPPRKAVTRLAGKLAGHDIDAARLTGLWDRAFAIPQEPGRADNGPLTPRQLPAAAVYFVGRAAELAELDDLAGLTEDRAACGPVAVAVICGTAGVGKTALAVYWAQKVASMFPDGQLFVDLRGYHSSGTPLSPVAALRGFLDALAPAPSRIPDSMEGQTALYRSLLAGRRMLIVLDNARDAEQVRPLLPGSPGSMVIVTSRNQLTSLVAADGAHPFSVDLLSEKETGELLARRIGACRAAAEPPAVAELVALCAGLPLAICVVAALAATRARHPLTIIAAELRDAQSRLDALDAGDPISSVRAAFSCSYEHLGAAASRMFRFYGLHPGPDLAAQAAAALAGVPLAEGRRALADLAAAALLTEHVPGRYRCHDLLRIYAEEQVHAREDGQSRRAAIHRMLDHYLHTAHSAALLLSPGRDPLALPPLQPGASPEFLADGEAALAWFDAEHRVLLAVITLATDAGFEMHAWQLTWSIGRFLDRRGHWKDWHAILRKALSAAERRGDLTVQAHLLNHLGIADTRLGFYQDARAHLRGALAFYEQIGDRKGMARVHHFAGMMLEGQGLYREALEHSQQALVLFWAAGQQAGQADALNAIGWFYAHLRGYQRAIVCCQSAFDLYREIGDRHGEAAALDSLGYAYHHLGCYPQAIASYQDSLHRYRDLGNRYYQADTLIHLGDAQSMSGSPGSAWSTWQQALVILDDLQHPAAAAVRARLDQTPG